ncbi:type II secretory pathway component PulK [Desulfobaculum xiamenense]|uniref:Type II secretory pathway component PulK n=1 Tax=Desulfobaculum xiamenense TaxID=995050 RepID=A0A846QVI4_9BACT|nr:type II secretion system protein GspK [Desulfobaculum xiamenense]NJB68649.1 type II secretory pathway component PulK [Desulfobaculum xiamenense]
MTGCPTKHPAPCGQRGAVLVLVLICMLALAAFVLGALDNAFRQAREPALLTKEYRTDMLAAAGLTAAIEWLGHDDVSGADTPLDDWASTWTGPGLTVRITPCNARLNLNWALMGENATIAGEEALAASARVKRAIETLTNDAKLPDFAMDNLLDWMDADTTAERLHGGEKSAYSSTGKPYTPRNALLPRPEEMLLVRGFENADVRWLRDNFTVWGEKDPAININFAPASVMKAFLPELESVIPNLVAYRQRTGILSPSDLMNDDIGLSREEFLAIDQYVTVGSGTFQVDIEAELEGWYQHMRCIVGRTNTRVTLISADLLENRLRD